MATLKELYDQMLPVLRDVAWDREGWVYPFVNVNALTKGGTMRPKRIRYYTMNSWNQSTAPAYNLKIHKVIPSYLQDKVFELREAEDFYNEINDLIREFDEEFSYSWQAGFNGRSGGYLVLYRGGRRESYRSICTACGQGNFKTVEETGKKCGRCHSETRVNRQCYSVYTQPGRGIDDDEVPTEVMKAFTKLANDIVSHTIWMARNCEVEEETYIVEKSRKVITKEV